MKTNIRTTRGFTLVELLVVIAIIVTLAGVATPVLLSQRKKGDHAKAIQNAKQLGYALFNFESDNSKYPEDDQDLIDKLDADLISDAGGSNDLLSQLLAGKYVDQEGPFFCRTALSINPDDDVTAGQVLKEGECGFGYVIKDNDSAFRSSNKSAIPLLVAPHLEGGGSVEFDTDIYNGRSVVLRIDMSVQTNRIDEDDNKIYLDNGEEMLASGAQTPFGTNLTPQVLAPAGFD